VYISAHVYGYIYIYNERQSIPDDTHGLCKQFNLPIENDCEYVWMLYIDVIRPSLEILTRCTAKYYYFLNKFDFFKPLTQTN
jgi:hypothetical protein